MTAPKRGDVKEACALQIVQSLQVSGKAALATGPHLSAAMGFSCGGYLDKSRVTSSRLTPRLREGINFISPGAQFSHFFLSLRPAND
jgi:hypothetical protein